MAHMPHTLKRDPPDAGYVLKKRYCSYIVRGVKLAIVHKRRDRNSMQAWNTSPVFEGAGAVQK